MTKFNVGDKVIFNKENAHVAKQFDYKINKPYEVQEVFPFYCTVQIINEKGSSHSFDEERFELVESKPTKNQRITALENEVAELRPLKQEVAELKLIVHELRGKKSIEPSTTNTVEDIIEFEGQQYRKVDREAHEGDVVMFTVSNIHYRSKKSYKVIENVKFTDENGQVIHVYNEHKRTPENVDVYELIKDGLNPQIPIVDETIEPLTPNQQRAAIIEKAKKFVDEAINQGKDGSPMSELGNETYQYKFFGVEFDVNDSEVKATVYQNNNRDKRMKQEPLHVSVAKCSPNDVFNEHIGKAIALGRALGLDVSEYEQAVQPNEVVMGMNLEVRTNGEVDFNHKPVDTDDLIQCNHDFHKEDSGVFIINDTNAIYEVIK
ncbi:hypothetical protein [Lysinibacillus sp. K60]|uniref:hypothetical protein n=1 Tax=Lysinibacillus sp. K60 TaxID=2720027 RepID=UPI001C8C21C2|nr:hypothetical protein [Lysinibacillus sp. K60]MBX8942468.1 hypothetical protein [Lysinibacillus sp. K60]